MRIQQLFKKDINREIQGVIKIGQKEKENIHQELEEYVVTEEVEKQLENFFDSYMKAYEHPTDKVGVWVSGFFGSGKSHFLKILSYLLNSGLENNGKRPVTYFEDKIQNSSLLNKMKRASLSPSEVALFNIDSKAEADTKQNKTAIVKVFNKVFNEMRGYSASIPWLAQLEETLEKNGTYESFQTHFEEETGFPWTEGRDELYYNMDEAIVALSKATEMSEESARNWIENGENNYSISVDSFAQRLKEYVDTKEDDYRLIFAADEVGQFISGNVQLMLNLQTVVEDLGKYCHGKVWVIVTSQQDIDSLRENLSATDYSKIQGRFNTRVSLSSANADEVIKIRLLDKREEAYVSLTLTFDEHEAALKNKLEFEDTATMRFYRDREDFARVYPFVPYQFNLLQKVFTGIREHGSAGKHLSDGERNLLESIQQATIENQEEEVGKLIPFHTFYENIDQALEHSVRSTISKANQNESLETFDVNVLRLLFLIRYVDEMPGTLKNLTTLMISSLEEDTLELSKRINESLNLLEKEFLIQRIGDKYLFLTNEEQDVNREIGRIQIPTSELVNEVGKMLVDDVLDLRRYTYRPFQDRPNIQYLIDISQWIDDRALRNPTIDLGIQFLTVYSEYTEEPEVIALSQREPKVVVQLTEEDFGDLRYYLKINQYLRNQSAKTKTPLVQEINLRKANERGQIQSVFKGKLQSAVEHAAIYVNGYEVETTGSPLKRMEEGLRVLVESQYPKINYMQKTYTKEMLEKLIADRSFSLLEGEYDDENAMATSEIERHLDVQQERNMLITLNELMKRYEAEPYGWKELDVLASLIRLMREEKITFTLNSRKMSVGEPDFLRTIQKKNTQERIIVKKRKVLDSRIVKKVRDVTKELFAVTAIGEKEEEMYATISDLFSKEEKKLEQLLYQYQYAPYPDKPLVEQGLKEIRALLAIEGASEFLTYLAEHGEDIIESQEDLRDVKDFLNSTDKKKIYNTAREKRDLYEEDRNYLNNEEINYIATQINDILKMARPYTRIRELNDLIDRFNLELVQQLENVSAPIKDALEQDKKDIEKELAELDGFPEQERIQRAYRFKYDDLELKVQNANAVGKLQSYKSESREIKIMMMRQIADAKKAISDRQERERQAAKERERKERESKQTETDEKEKPTGQTTTTVTPKPKPEKEIKAERELVMGREDVLPRRMVELRTEEDILNYVETIKGNLMNSLDEADVIKLM